ncbi:MAG: HAMP domain-containing sensor histidine kinase [Leptospira sp.]|nr:HAMP domain-containing sensor histidine kinase [Leptospira sp.]
MKKLIEWVSRVLDVGKTNDLTVDSLVRVQITNLVTVLVILSNVQYTALFFYFQIPGLIPVTLVNGGIAFGLFGVFYLNKIGKYHLAKTILISFISVPITFSAFFYLGPEPGIHYFYLIFIILPFVLFSYENKFLIFFFLVLNLILYDYFEFFCKSYQYEFNSIHPRSFIINFLRITCVVSSISLLSFFMFYFLRNVYKNQSLLIRSNFNKDRIFSILAHDLKGPIGSMSTFLDILIEDLPEKGQLLKSLKELRKNTNQSYMILENLLDWVRKDSGKLNFTQEYVLVKQIIDDVIELLRFQISEKNIQIVQKIPLDLEVYCDQRNTSTILRNVLSNAIKYSLEGGQVVMDWENKGNMIWFHITDSGVGMTEQTLMSINRKEGVSTQYGTKGEKGTGLGLLVSFELIENQGGEFRIESELKKGTNFSFSLPRLAPSN